MKNLLQILASKFKGTKLTVAITSVISSSAMADGGISGGGGGSVPENPVGKFAIEAILKEVRGELLMFFQSQDDKGGSAYFSSLYTASPNIYDIIRRTTIGVKEDGPCIGTDGHEYDGSIVGPEANSICISLKNLGEKLTRDNALRQTVALVAHEYAHLVGYDEEKATKLQKHIVYHYEESVPQRRTGFFFDVVLKWRDMLAKPRTEFVRSLAALSNVDFSEVKRMQLACKQAHVIEQSSMDDLIFLKDDIDSFLPMPDYSYQPLILDFHLKVAALRMATCGLQSPADQEYTDAVAYGHYLNVFNPETSITAAEFRNRLPGGAGQLNPPITNVLISKISTSKDAIKEIQELIKGLHGIDMRLDEYGVPMPLVNF